MSQLSEQKFAQLMKTRLAKFGCRLTDDDAVSLMVLLRAQGYKLTAREPEEEMLAAVDGVLYEKGGEGKASSALHASQLVWQKMWEAA